MKLANSGMRHHFPASCASAPPFCCIAAGACTAEDLDPIVVRVGTGNNERFGQAAVEAGIVTERQVVDALGRQAAHRYTRACKHHEAKYEFVEGLRSQAQNRFVAAPVAVA